MKKKLLLALCLLSVTRCLCQQKVFELLLDSGETSSLQVFPVIDTDSGNILLTLTSNFDLQRFRVPLSDTSFAGHTPPIDSWTVTGKKDKKQSLLPLYDHYLATTPQEGGVEEAFLSENAIRFMRTIYGRGPARQADSIQLAKGELLFAAFYKGGEFYALTARKGSDDVRIWHRHPGGRTSSDLKRVMIKDWGTDSFRDKIPMRDLVRLAKNIAVVSTAPGIYPPLIPMLRKSKLYVSGNKVYITYDNLRLETRLIELPLDDQPARIRIFNPIDWYGKEPSPGFSNGNSFIFDSTLIVAAIVHLQFYMAVYDLTTGKLRASYMPDPTGQPGFAHSPAWQVGDLWKKDKIHRTSMSEFYHNSFNFWNLSVTGGHYGNNQMELEIGTTYDRGSIGKAMLGLGAISLAAAGVLPAALLLRPGSGTANTMYFKAHFAVDSMQPLVYPAFDDKSQLIDTFAGAQKIASNASFILSKDGNFWCGYLNAEEGKYTIYKF